MESKKILPENIVLVLLYCKMIENRSYATNIILYLSWFITKSMM